MAYNASVKTYWVEADGARRERSVFMAEVAMLNGRPQMVRGNGAQCTGYEGKTLAAAVEIDGVTYAAGDAAYEVYLRATSPGIAFEVIEDGGAAYKGRLDRMGLPPAYRR